ncbi:tRNA pseudouridine synthase B [Cucurbitaria berberidis CBS 394.84]|uniref:tRNA pseudouridine(55) synthase n=1 Tax=Cucurbitaria berberidis CBS 394.84 TaxID=1168544 RepID=A0A9P4GDM5_9PLEO|nr:tRNA pseudouridine synthase B [Cucurbitaria berberidis CBS 394.84]KAF1843295.1 tRNA pseudouridine synthase B [Cucurbitaria berberidis CBS 394.84]
MEQIAEKVLEGVFAVTKPAHVSSADVLEKLQATFAPSQLFAPLLNHQPKRPSKDDHQVFKLGHGGTLDPLAAGVLIVGIGRGTKHLQQYLACSKTYETVVIFGASTDTYDCTGVTTELAEYSHVSKEMVEEKLAQFRGTIQQQPPVYSALKINGIKACEYVRQGKELPRELESREMQVDECTLLEWNEAGQHNIAWPGENSPAPAPAARIRLTVSSGFYVRSFAHDLGLACQSRSHMSSLLRTRQATFTIQKPPESLDLISAISYTDLEAGEDVWGGRLRPQLERWVEANPLRDGHINGRDEHTKTRMAKERAERPRQRFRGEWMAEEKKERIKQQGGKFKGKWSRKPVDVLPSSHTPSGDPKPVD